MRPSSRRLTTARIVNIDILTLHQCLPAFESLTSLQLTGLKITVNDYGLYGYDNDAAYGSFRGALMTLPSLRHLELFVTCFVVYPARFPTLLSGI